MHKKKTNQDQGQAGTYLLLHRLTIVLLMGYTATIVLFYFLAGEQLHLRDSRGNLELLPAESGTVELVAGSVVEQQFSAEIQRLEQIDVQWGTYYRQNTGTVIVELVDLRDDQILMSQSYDAATILEGGLTTLTVEEPIEGLCYVPLSIRITSLDGIAGSAVSPMMNLSGTAEQTLENSLLLINGNTVEGTLCFSARGTDYIWTGLHYWKFAAAGFALLVGSVLWVGLRVMHGKRSYIVNALIAMQKYRFLIRQLVSRDFKTKYKRSILGVFWSFLNPLLTMLVQYFVFSNIFKSDVANFAAYLIIGTVMFNFFSEASGMALTSIVGNAALITKVYMPKYIYPLTRVISSLVNLTISLIPMLIVCIFTGVGFHRSVVLSLFFLGCLAVFSLGLGLLLSAAMVFFRDTQFLWGVFSMMWMYATPIFYPESILPDNLKFILQINPIYHFLKNTRLCILGGISPEPAVYVHCLLMAAGALLIGSLVFQKSQDRFILYL